jgi:hypothetical protein
MPYIDGYSTCTIRTLSFALTVRCMVQVYVILTVKRWPSWPCIWLYCYTVLQLNSTMSIPKIEVLTNLVGFHQTNEDNNNNVLKRVQPHRGGWPGAVQVEVVRRETYLELVCRA